MIKKTIVYISLTLFLFQSMLFGFMLFSFTLLAKLEENDAETQELMFTEEEYRSLKLNNSEFLFNDNMYDIIKSTTKDHTIILHCKIDAKEKDLLEKLIESFKHSKGKKNFSFSLIADISRHSGDQCFFYGYTTINTPCSYTLLNHAMGILSPPPKA